MKTSKFTPAVFILFFFLGISACNNADRSGAKDEPGWGTDPLENQTNDQGGAQDFSREAASDGMMEIEMADEAIERSKNDQVKELARMIKRDHQEANNKLQDMARTNNWQLPREPLPRHREHLQMLNDVSDEDFDKKYLSMMVDAHKKAIDKFERAAMVTGDQPDAELNGNDHQEEETPGNANDRTNRDESYDTYSEGDNSANKGSANMANHPALSTWINNTMPVLRKHLKKAQELQSTIQ